MCLHKLIGHWYFLESSVAIKFALAAKRSRKSLSHSDHVLILYF